MSVVTHFVANSFEVPSQATHPTSGATGVMSTSGDVTTVVSPAVAPGGRTPVAASALGPSETSAAGGSKGREALAVPTPYGFYEGECNQGHTEWASVGLTAERIDQLDANFRAANFLGAAQIYLRSDTLLRRPLRPEDIKARLLGHWGTQPGLNLLYGHLSRLVQDTAADILLLIGPGHGAPGVLASLFLEGTLVEYYPGFSQDSEGVQRLVHDFSWPGGWPSHLTAQTPGTIHEGGELGYSLSHAYGAAFDNPDLIVACVIGDGEAETGALAASWRSLDYLDPVHDGAVLPILHLNGYKLSGPSLLARLAVDELHGFLEAIGHQVREVAGSEPRAVHAELAEAMDWAHREIRRIQNDARSDSSTDTPHWPMIILRTPKGWTGPKFLDGHAVEGTFHAHQVPIEDPATNPAHLRLLEEWLRSYRPEELFDRDGRPVGLVTSVYPGPEKRIGRSAHANGGKLLKPLPRLDLMAHAVSVPAPGQVQTEGTAALGAYLEDLFAQTADERNFRLFSPDEASSNRLQAIYGATLRAFELPTVPTDEFLSRDGRVMDILSEHCCEGWLEGYLLTGRHGLFACYEAFVGIVDSMMTQYSKWLKMSRDVPWRAPLASLNYLLTSHVWEQDHNGFSHQGPTFMNLLMTRRAELVRIYLPPDANCLLAVAEHCLQSRDRINLIVASKKPMPQWLSMSEAQRHCAEGASVWEWAGSGEGDADIVLAAAGDVPMRETLAAAWWLRREIPELRVRVVNVLDLFTLDSRLDHPHGLEDAAFEELFPPSADVVFAFHGYPGLIHELIYRRPNPGRFHVRGYIEEGTTTTPFDMTVLNRMSRYDLAIEALRRSPRLGSRASDAIGVFERKLTEHAAYIRAEGRDLPEVVDWRWTP
jgi:xylulose-5-phosphate/fructose-6-phosphate phosphoketolase